MSREILKALLKLKGRTDMRRGFDFYVILCTMQMQRNVTEAFKKRFIIQDIQMMESMDMDCKLRSEREL
ncbi:MAG: hypothetical protein Q7J27_05340 [Syntrophales bacterium]|nr:hypothetical protein [Syntrophales bacterium]